MKVFYGWGISLSTTKQEHTSKICDYLLNMQQIADEFDEHSCLSVPAPKQSIENSALFVNMESEFI
ncbi:MAG: hypothetical protein ACI35P_03940 [Bacillus sp. (in: firmicutes)]